MFAHIDMLSNSLKGAFRTGVYYTSAMSRDACASVRSMCTKELRDKMLGMVYGVGVAEDARLRKSFVVSAEKYRAVPVLWIE